MGSNGKTIDVQNLLDQFSHGHRLSLARLISLVENDAPEAPRILSEIAPKVGRAHRVGITGPPGAGKSTLVNELALAARRRKEPVGIVAVDPTSPFSGGAILGDRVRMDRLASDPGVFIRSMATRGSLGGLAHTTKLVADLLDAFGSGWIWIETVGVGQAEVDIVSAADTVVVVLVPESGDGIQVMKAGLMEIADVFVVNKSDRPGADLVVQEIRSLLSGRPLRDTETWIPPIVKTSANEGKGISELDAAIRAHKKHLTDTGALLKRRRARLKERIKELVEWNELRRLWGRPGMDSLLETQAAAVAAGKRSLMEAADALAPSKEKR